MPMVEADVRATDIEWEKWGARDPYFGVLTHERFRAATIAEDDYDAFFETGRGHVEAVVRNCMRHFGDGFELRRVLDFGCGVGRVLLPFAEKCDAVVGVDVSESMLIEARRNCSRFNVANASFVLSDDRLSAVVGQFDLVHSTIVLQHIESERGLNLIARLVELVAPGGGVAIQVTYGRNYGDCHYGRPTPQRPQLPRARPLYRRALSAAGRILFLDRAHAPEPTGPSAPDSDPVMMMYHYDLSRIAYILHAAGATGFYAEFTDHGGELGTTLYARTRSPAAAESSDVGSLSLNVNQQVTRT